MTDEKNTSTGLKENVASCLCYALGWVTGLIFLLVEKENKTVRFHAWQSLVAFLGLWIASMVIMVIPVLGAIVSMLLGLGSFILWIVMMIKTYQGERIHLPIAGDIAEKQSSK